MIEESDFKTHLFTYRHDGAEWVLPLKAASPDDAKRRLTNIAAASYQGEVVARISTPRFTCASRLWKWLRLRG